jgi:hypothetical protein
MNQRDERTRAIVRRSVATPSPISLLDALILALCVRFISSADPLEHRGRPRSQPRARLGVFVPILTAAIGAIRVVTPRRLNRPNAKAREYSPVRLSLAGLFGNAG